jgi:predicted nuclease with TOPRIM domain
MVEPTELEMGRLFQKVDTIIENQGRFLELHEKLDERITEKHEKLSTRLNSVENKIHWYTGGMAAVSATLVFMGDQIRRVFFGH